ncbi:MAG: helix-turn-helix transcriptional regulator [Myxococcales bacterium]|nr:helix-turn-helix transcriptional regulator [Myxococcales bacterium]
MTKSSTRARASSASTSVTVSEPAAGAPMTEALLLGEGDEIGAAELTRRVAETVRVLRKNRGYSLDDLAQRSGVSRASLSQIETAKTNPTISILWKIAAALGVPFAQLLGEERPERVRILRRADQQVLRSTDGRMESRPLMPAGASPTVEAYELRLQPRSISVSEPHAKGTTETIVVLVGALRLRVADEVFELNAGDSVYFHADVAHAYENPGRVEARYHNVITYAR